MACDFMPCLTMVIIQVGYAGMNILSKLAMNSGMNPFVQVAYRQIFATLVIAPFAYFSERKSRPIMTKNIFWLIVASSIFGASLNQILYFVGLQRSTPTIACALTNLLPAFTFILALPFRLEKVGLKRRSGQAKVLGTLICVGGAMFLSFYKGPRIIPKLGFHWEYLDNMTKGKSSTSASGLVGPFLLIASTLSWGIWFIIQAKMSELYPAPNTTSALICLMASIECSLVALIVDRDASAWSLTPPIRAVSSVYAGIVCTALAFCVMSWCIQRRGPLYVSIFSPLLLIIVAVLSWALLDEKIYLGTAIGSGFIVLGLYAVLWGKNKEMSQLNVTGSKEDDNQEVVNDMEIQFCELENGNTHSWGIQFSEVPNGNHKARS